MNRLPSPPSERSARNYGIAALCSHLLCLLGAPFAIGFGIMALVRHGRAKREHEAERARYASPSSSGLAMGIIALSGLLMVLPVTGIVSAIAIPALLGQRSRARIKVVHSMVGNAAAEAARVSDGLKAAQPEAWSGPQVISRVLANPSFQVPAAANPYGGTGPAFVAGPPTGPGVVGLTFRPAYQDPASGQTFQAVVVEGLVLDPGKGMAESRVIKAVALD